jgi:hypothetical protein
MSSTVFGVAFDAEDAQAVASFWASALGRTVADGATGDNAAVSGDPAIPGSRIGFHRVPEGKTVKNPAATGPPWPTPRATSSTSSTARRG